MRNKNGIALDSYFAQRLEVKDKNQWNMDVKEFGKHHKALSYAMTEQKMINQHANAEYRAVIFAKRFKGYVCNLQDTCKEPDINHPSIKRGMRKKKRVSSISVLKSDKLRSNNIVSFEATALSDYSNDFVIKNKKRQDEAELISFNLEESTHHQELYGEELLTFIQIFSSLWKDIQKDLKGWSHSTSKRKKIIAEAVWALGSLINIDIVNQALEITPCLLKYYEDIIEFQKLTESPESGDVYASTYESIALLAKQGADNPLDKEVAVKIIVIAEKIIALNTPVIHKDKFDQVIEKVVAQLLNAAYFPEIDQTDVLAYERYLTNAWDSWLLDQCALQKDLQSIDDILNNKSALVLPLISELSNLCSNHDETSKKLLSISQEEPSNIRERRKVQKNVIEITQIKIALESKITEKTDEVVTALFPEQISTDEIDDFELPNETWEKRNTSNAFITEIDTYLLTEAVDQDTEQPKSEGEQSHEVEHETSKSDESEQTPDQNDETINGLTEDTSAKDLVLNKYLPEIVDEKEKPEVEEHTAMQLEPVIVDINEGDTSIEEVDDTDGFIDNYVQLEKTYRQHWLKTGSVSATLVNNTSLAFIKKSNLPASYWVCKTAIQGDMQSEGLIDPELWKASYFGLNIWGRTNRSLLQAQKIMSNIHPHMIEHWLDLRPGGKIVPYLIFTATFQTALFTGGYTTAPTLLSMIKHRFDAATERLIKDVLESCNRNEQITLDILRGQKDDKQGLTHSTLLQQLSDWKDKIVYGHSGWTPMRKALKNCVESGEFTPIISIIENNNSSDSVTVMEFVQKYSVLDDVEKLMTNEVAIFQGETYSGKIEGNARNAFLRNINELCELSRQWLFRQDFKSSPSGELRGKIERLKTQFKTALTYFNNIQKNSTTYEITQGATIAGMAIGNLIQAIEGDDSVVWEYERVEAWFNAPRDLLAKEHPLNDPVGQNLNLISQLPQTIKFDALVNEAMQSQLYPLAHILLLNKRDSGDDVTQKMDELNKASAALRSEFNARRDLLDAKIAIARDSKLFDEQRYYQLGSELDYLKDDIAQLSSFDSTTSIEEQIASLENSIEELFTEKLETRKNEFNANLKTLRTELGDDSVPETWIQIFNQAFQSWDLLSIDEQLNELRTAIKDKTPIHELEVVDLRLTHQFEEVEEKIYKFLLAHSNFREVSKVSSLNNQLGLDFTDSPKEFKGALEFVAAMRGKRQRDRLNREFYESNVNLLKFLGFKPETELYSDATRNVVDYKLGDGFVRLNLRVKPSNAPKPFPVFGSTHDEQDLTIIFAFKDWEPERLDNLITTDFGARMPIVVSAVPQSKKQRNHFAKYNKNRLRTVFMIDLTMLVFLGTLSQEKVGPEAINNFLWLTAPWTYYNPYDGSNTLKPPPVEIRYGREYEIDKLLSMQGGDAIIFGGRQLGKSTILSEVQRKSHKPEKNKYAFYHLMDANIIRVEDRNQHEWELARDNVWDVLYRDFITARMIKPSTSTNGHQSKKEAIKEALRSHKGHRIIIILDEVDALLDIDHSHNFAIFRGLRELVNMTEQSGQFKLIIAGLQHARRFQDSPNYPLPQLGGVMQISIMSHSDSAKLIKEPLTALGYCFEKDSIINRIKSITNRHPGLIQIFCHELVDVMAKNHHSDVGHTLITDQQINIVESKEGFRALLQDRFDLTLNLDQRYKVIIYGLLFEGKGEKPFSIISAKEIAETWLPSAFANQSAKQFETFLLELVGLGVLIKINEQQYSLRNTNVLRLLGAEGSEQNIEHMLETSINELKYFDPLERHAFIKKANMPCPVTFRDEKDLIGSSSLQNDDGLINGKRKTNYTVSIITGSEALGLYDLSHTIPYLYELESYNQAGGIKLKVYKCIVRNTEYYESPAKLKQQINTAIQKLSKSDPIMLIIEDIGNMPIHHMISLLDIAHQFGDIRSEMTHPVRIIFSLTPKALWNWLESSDITNNRESLQPFIALHRWKGSGLGYFLGQIGMNDTRKEVENLQRISDGWHNLLKNLCQLKLKAKKLDDIQSFGDKLKPIKDCTPKIKRIFERDAGLQDVDWALPLLKGIINLCEESPFDYEDVSLVLDEQNIEGLSINQIMQALDWLSRLSIIRKVKRGKHKKTFYDINQTIRACITRTVDE